MAFYSAEPPIPAGQTLCPYGRYGVVGRAVRDAWEGLLTRRLVVLAVTAAGSIAGILVGAALPAKSGDALRIGAGIGVFCAAIGAGVLVGLVCALTPWGRRCHWEGVFHPYTLGGPFDGLGCSLVSHHWHSILDAKCVVVDPDGNRVEFPFQPHAHQKVLAEPDQKVDSLSGSSIFGDTPKVGKYKLEWIAKLEGRNQPATLATAKYRVKG